ncbi:peptide-methionine (S)-S-oxide reductase MsrA [Flocculibacter collagenilyticus]|uniref:peptide-methionine (S)-S-oxide reductase MsrA n=1 Tax=Flocculibacter collagenilyticus TaxID=2744479 RepID=UPI0018F54066|nr:peptide-methionine (S)-S-oxide reductase MsrA [Flocculibacter collagenilyticus]
MNNLQKATFAGGCFWCIEAAFNKLKGVKSAISGYIDGDLPNPTYKDICTGQSGYAEAVAIEFDASMIDYETLLKIFFTVHDPTQVNKQGYDVGTQYRSAIYYHSDSQKHLAKRMIEDLNQQKIWPLPIATTVAHASQFYSAESEHQLYAVNNPNQPYCQLIINPKLEKLKSAFQDYIK